MFFISTNQRSEHKFVKGEIVGAMFAIDNMFYRARIMEICDDGKADVFYVDYGDSLFVDTNTLVPLT